MNRVRRRILPVVLTAFLAGTGGAQAQGPDFKPAWTLTGSVVTFRVSEGNGWGIGPAAGAQRRLGGRLRLDFHAAALLSSSGFYDFTGVALDLGPAIGLTRGRVETSMGIGGSALAGGDSDGTGGGWVGGYIAGQATAWLGRRLGMSVRGAFRQVTTGRTSPSVAVGLALRL